MPSRFDEKRIKYRGFPPPPTGCWGQLPGDCGLLRTQTSRRPLSAANLDGPCLVALGGVSLSTILVVDDEPLARWSVSETLRDSGYGVVEAGDAASALRAISTPGSAADLVLLDYSLPDSNDLGLLSTMHALRPATPIILMTAYGTDELFEEARQRGATASLHKPFEMTDLSPLVARVLATLAH